MPLNYPPIDKLPEIYIPEDKYVPDSGHSAGRCIAINNIDYWAGDDVPHDSDYAISTATFEGISVHQAEMPDIRF